MTLGSNDSAIASVLAFYLPQYHAIPENDQWWGSGFTDWTNVRRARPLFAGHLQPRIPTTLGYYDLSDPAVHHAQATLARRHGVSAFCYYAYWFGGRRLLERPLDLVASNPDLAMPYAICWANEPWTRRWDGAEDQVLMPQDHSPEGDAAFIDTFAGHLADPRYVRVEGKPLLLIYRAGLLVDPLRTTDGLRERALRLGLGELYLTMVQSFGHWEPFGYGFDAAVEFPPHNLDPGQMATALGQAPPRRKAGVTVAAYRDAIRVVLATPVPQFPWFRTVFPGWDNTPRRGVRGRAYLGGTPELFQTWLEQALICTYLFQPRGERLLFINAWNEWAEGAFLEPDESGADAYLKAIEAAIARTTTIAEETAAQMGSDVNPRGLLEYARREWRLGQPALRP